MNLQYELLKHEYYSNQFQSQPSSATTPLYRPGGIFSREMFEKLDGFRNFVDLGYYELKKRLAHDVCDAFLMKPASRTNPDL